MVDISNELVNIMSEQECSSVCALFMLKEKEDEQSNVSAISTTEVCTERNSVGAGH
jgi:hypothetical protein